MEQVMDEIAETLNGSRPSAASRDADHHSTVKYGAPRIVRVLRDATGGPQLLDDVLPRIEQFSRRFGGNPASLRHAIWSQVGANSPLIAIWAVMRRDAIRGHVLCTIDQWEGRSVAWVNQTEFDVPSERHLLDGMLEAMDLWVGEVNRWFQTTRQPHHITELMMVTPRMSEAWARHVGFDAYRLLCRREVKHG